ncbi:MAG: hypothetical protein ACFFAO_06905 [Candidatus Hermodarchaeota archaeon]
MDLTPFELYFIGPANIVFVVISLIVSIKLILKYFKLKKKDLLYTGITWFGIILPWFATSLSFVYTITTGELISYTSYILIAIPFLPIAVFFWLITFTDLVAVDKKKVILGLFSIYGIIFEIMFFYLLFTQPNQLGEMVPPFRPKYAIFIQVNLVILIVFAFTTAVIFSIYAMRSSNPEVVLKGKFLLYAFVVFFTVAILETIITPDVITIIKRIFMISSAIAFYFGFYLPNWLKDRILEKE